jgi:hypothetical protein
MERAGFLSEERKSGRTKARGKTKELLVNNRAAIPERASLHRAAPSDPKAGEGLIGSRSSAESAPCNQAAHLPEGRKAWRLVQPRLDLRRGRVTDWESRASVEATLRCPRRCDRRF